MMQRLSYLLLLILFSSACSGQPAPAVKKEAAQEAVPRVNATHIVPLRKQVGRTATVYGRVERTGKSSRSGHQFLNFANTEFSVVCLAPDVANFKQGPPADLYQDKDVEVTGTVELYRGKVQIRLREPSQIKVAEPETGRSGSAASRPPQ